MRSPVHDLFARAAAQEGACGVAMPRCEPQAPVSRAGNMSMVPAVAMTCNSTGCTCVTLAEGL
jgi:hypothetical protein